MEHPIEEPDQEYRGRSTSSEEAPEYFGALSLKNENIMCDIIGFIIRPPGLQGMQNMDIISNKEFDFLVQF